MKLTIVVPCRNAVKTIAAQLDALGHQQWRDAWEVIVADNGSTDGTQQLVESYYGRLPGLRLIDASDRRGAAHARNSAAKIATGDALVFCDADDEVGIGWLTAIGKALQTHDFVVSRMDVDKLNPAWLALTLNNVQGKEIRRAYYPPYLCHAGSSGMAVKKSLHDRVGGFDEVLREREDTDYCFRIQLLGYELHFVAEATIHIRYNENSEALFHQARRWGSYQS
jgi:glycosyltransferase involved in cell wall biosynthesis